MPRKEPKYRLLAQESLVPVMGLIFSIVFVSLIYAVLIRPQAKEVAITNTLRAVQEEDDGFVPERNLYVILKDYEQQVCFILLLWAMILIGYKLIELYWETRVLEETTIDIDKGERIIPEEALSHAKHFESQFEQTAHAQDRLLCKVVLTALRRFHSTRSIQDVSQAVQEISGSEGERLDSDLSLVRYIAWAIPSVGFIGTVRGIGEALTKADQAIRGNIQGVTESLGLAFNSTLIALFLSIVLMAFIHLLQARQESLILEIEEFCREKLIAVMKIPSQEESELPFS